MEGKEVYKAIARVTAALSQNGIAKTSKNLQQGYNYRGIDAIYNALSSELANADLCIIPRVISREAIERQNKSGGALFYVTIHAEYDIVSAIDGSCHTASAYGEAMDSGDKATNKAMSAAYKYLAMQLFCIPTEGDNDADASTHEVRPRQQTQASYSAPANSNGGAGKASEKQIKMLFGIWNSNGYEGDLRTWVQTNYRCKVDDLTVKQASEAIEALQPEETTA